MSWDTVKLEEICDVIRGVTYSSDQSFNDSSECEDLIPILRAGNIQNQLILDDKLVWVSKDLVKEQQIIKAEDILMCTSSGSSDLVGKNAIADQNWYGSYGAFCANLRNKNKDRLNSKFLYFYLNSDGFSNWTKKSSGANIKNIRISELRDFCAPLPPLHQQQRIADILDKAEAITQKREQALTLCDEFLRATFLDMFGDPVSNPKGWDVKKLSRFGEVITGSTPSRGKPEYYGNHIEWIKSDNINTPNNYITRAKEFLSVEGESVGRSVPENSILMTCIAGSLDCIGNIALTDRKVSFNQQVNGIVPNDDVDIYFLYSLLLYSKKYIQNHSTNSMKGMISKGKLSEIKFYLPEMAIQKEFSDIFLKIESVRNKIQSAQELPLFEALSQQAFKGELTQ